MVSNVARSPQLKLSHLMSSMPAFSFIEELVNIPQPNESNFVSLSQHDLFKINKALDDIDLYLNDLIVVFNNIKEVSRHTINVLDWFYEGKTALQNLLRDMDSIDSIISRLLLVIESTDSSVHISQGMIRKFEEVSDVLLDVKKSSIILKKNLDVSTNYHDLMESVIKSLTIEIEECTKSVIKMKDYKLSSPKRVLPKFNLNDIVSKMKINEFISTSVSVKSIRLPTFNDLDQEIYEEFMCVEHKILPLRISLDIVPAKIEEFNTLCSSSSFKVSREHVLSNYEVMLDKWKFLDKQFKLFKSENIDSKWNVIFMYLIHQIEQECDGLIDILAFSDTTSTDGNSTISEDIGSRYKVCSNSINLIESAIIEGITTDKEIPQAYNKKLHPKWMEVNDLILRVKADSDMHDTKFQQKQKLAPKSKGLRSFRTMSKNSHHDVFDRPMSNGIGIDFNVDVESVTMPLSVTKKDRVKDFLTGEKPKGKDLKNTLIQVFEGMNIQDREDEEETLVKTPLLKGPIELQKQQRQKVVSFDFDSYTNNILNSSSRPASKLPRIVSNYIELGYPKFPKKGGFTRIPEIDVTHPVFQSPYRGNFQHANRTLPISIDISPPSCKDPTDPFYITRSRASSNATVIGRPNSLLNETTIPNLAYSRRLSYNCTSPERPLSSLGSRFDDENLLKSLHENRPIWK
ncbi:Kar9 protein [Candida orthopsilosis Co 90-125]|uniref:Kar9 protein n=1 Tax=Candida orthopsilosis (strain 90-125) TaxID=1136231 RepID=H8X4S2_CANO9|nr:Kar9 protein [Candida orthopsilosis Co 90-125]CCG23014.1 Kar9 protein [Candida orthopsilosis Co 90-125]